MLRLMTRLRMVRNEEGTSSGKKRMKQMLDEMKKDLAELKAEVHQMTNAQMLDEMKKDLAELKSEVHQMTNAVNLMPEMLNQIERLLSRGEVRNARELNDGYEQERNQKSSDGPPRSPFAPGDDSDRSHSCLTTQTEDFAPA